MYIALARNLVHHVDGTWHVQAPAYTLLIEPGQELVWRQEMPEVLRDSLVDKLLLEMKVLHFLSREARNLLLRAAEEYMAGFSPRADHFARHRRRKQPDKPDIRLAQALADQRAQAELLRSKQEQARQV